MKIAVCGNELLRKKLIMELKPFFALRNIVPVIDEFDCEQAFNECTDRNYHFIFLCEEGTAMDERESSSA